MTADEVTLEDISHDTWGNEELLLAVLVSMCADRRIDLAQELLKGTGKCVATEVDWSETVAMRDREAMEGAAS